MTDDQTSQTLAQLVLSPVEFQQLARLALSAFLAGFSFVLPRLFSRLSRR